MSHLYGGKNEELLNLVEKSLKIFQAMDGIAVARQCAELTQDIFSIAKASSQSQRRSAPGRSFVDAAGEPVGPTQQLDMTQQQLHQASQSYDGTTDFPTSEDAFFDSLMDPNLLESFGTNLNDLNLEIASLCNFDVMGSFAP